MRLAKKIMKLVFFLCAIVCILFLFFMLDYYLRFPAAPLKIHICSESQVKVNSRILDISQLKALAEKHHKKGCESIIVSGGENEMNDVFWRIQSECSQALLFDCSVAYKDVLIPLYAGTLCGIHGPKSPTPLVKGDFVGVMIENNEIFIGQEYDEDWNLLNKGKRIDLSNMREEIYQRTLQGQLPLEILCENRITRHSLFLEVLYAYYISGGKYIFAIQF